LDVLAQDINWPAGWPIAQCEKRGEYEVARILTEKEKEQIWASIMYNMTPDDRHPYEVIRDSYGGDEIKYLLDMGVWHGIIERK